MFDLSIFLMLFKEQTVSTWPWQMWPEILSPNFNGFSKLISSPILIFLNFNFIHAFSVEPDVFVQSTVNRASEILAKNISQEEKINKLKVIAKETVDIQGVGFYSLGSARKNLNETQKVKYSALFESYFLKSFSSRLSEYSDPKINVLNPKYLNEKYTMVSSILVGDDKRPEIKIEWRVYTKDPENPLIRDLIIEGLSLARTQKEEFASILSSNNNDINILISKLNEFVNNWLVGPPGLEPGTNTLWVYCSNQLSYRPKNITNYIILFKYFAPKINSI